MAGARPDTCRRRAILHAHVTSCFAVPRSLLHTGRRSLCVHARAARAQASGAPPAPLSSAPRVASQQTLTGRAVREQRAAAAAAAALRGSDDGGGGVDEEEEEMVLDLELQVEVPLEGREGGGAAAFDRGRAARYAAFQQWEDASAERGEGTPEDGGAEETAWPGGEAAGKAEERRGGSGGGGQETPVGGWAWRGGVRLGGLRARRAAAAAQAAQDAAAAAAAATEARAAGQEEARQEEEPAVEAPEAFER